VEHFRIQFGQNKEYENNKLSRGWGVEREREREIYIER